MSDPIEPKPVLTAIHPGKKVSDESWNVIRALYEQGEKSHILSERFGIQPGTIRKRAWKEKWATPQRVSKAVATGRRAVDDPASAVADLWEDRKQAARESVYQGSKKALERFFSMSPVPQNFQEAQIAQKMLDKAIDPSEGKASQTNVNLAVLTSQDFSPRVIDV